MIALIARIVGDRALAEDLAQESFIKAYRNLAAFDTTRRLSSWLFRIAHNTAVDRLRRSQPAMFSLDAPAPNAERGNYERASSPTTDPVEREALRRALNGAIAQLRREYREAVTLRYDEGLSFEEIAQVMSIPEATARSHVHRARKELAAILRAQGWEHPEA